MMLDSEYRRLLDYVTESEVRVKLLRELEKYLSRLLAHSRGSVVTIRVGKIAEDHSSSLTLHQLLRSLTEFLGIRTERGRGSGGRKTVIMSTSDAWRLLQLVRKLLSDISTVTYEHA